MIVNYSVNDDFYFRIINEKSRKVNRLRWCYFETDKNIVPDLVLNLGQFQAENEYCTVLSHKYHVKENYFYCKDKGVEGVWKVEIKNMNESPVVSLDFRPSNPFKNLFMKEYMAQDFLVPFLELGLFKKGYLLLHGGFVEKDKQAFLVSGMPGSFKTTVLMDLVRWHDFNYLSDDRVLISAGQSHPFPISPFLFDYTLHKTETEKRSFLNNIDLIRRMLNGVNSSAIPSRGFTDFTQIFLISRKYTKDLTIRQVNKDEAFNKLFLINFLEYVSSFPKNPLKSFNKYLLMYSLLYPDNIFVKYWQQFKQTLTNIFQDVSFYEIILPIKYDPSYVDKIKVYWESSVNRY